MSVRPLTALFALASLFLLIPAATTPAADEWLPILPEDLKMTSEPKAPGAPAIYLFRNIERDDQFKHENHYSRIKVLTEEGRDRANIEILYDPSFESVHSIKARTVHVDGTIINFDGKIFDKSVVKAHDIKRAAKTFTLPDVQVGSILEYRYTIDFPGWLITYSRLALNSDLFIRRAKYSFKLNERYTARWIGSRLPNGVTLPKSTSFGNTLPLEISDVPAYAEEEFSPPEDEVRATLTVIYSQNRETEEAKFWKAEGKKMYDATENFVGKHGEIARAAAEIAPESDPPEVKLQKLYAKVQTFRNTSYEVGKTEEEKKREKTKVDETVDIADVWKKGAGTALHLNWLFLGLARASGFQAFDVVLAPRDTSFFSAKTMNPGLLNYHVVLVKLNGADKYLDPGRAFNPFGLLGWPETGITGLRLDKEGGTWVETPIPASADTRIMRKANLMLDAQGTLSGKLTLTLTGLAAQRQRRAEVNEDDVHRKNYLEQLVHNSIPSGSEVELANKPDWTSSSREFAAEYSLKIPGWASAAGRKAFIPVGIFSNREKHVFEHSSRTSMICFDYPYQLADDITIELPLGWRVDSLPAAQNRNMGVFIYTNSVGEKGGTIHLARSLEMNAVTVDEKNYPVLRAIFQYVRNSDDQQIVVLPPAAAGQN